MTSNHSATPYTAANSSDVICHAVPCHIEYTGPASGIDTFFNPMDISSTVTAAATDSSKVQQDEKSLPVSDECYQAAMIRGRGLLARGSCSSGSGSIRGCPDGVPLQPEDHHPPQQRLCGHVFQVVNQGETTMTHYDSTDATASHPQQQRLQSIQAFDQYVEWYHEHQPSLLPTSTRSTRYGRAMEWIDTADCLHAPLPIPILEGSKKAGTSK